MPTMKLRFPGGRYHATPWGHHVNEGLIEWPPSPWRLLRALIACGFSSQRWSEVPPIAQRLINKLAAVLPLYRLPAASAAHSRHFMPIGVLAKGREQTTLVFDTWANVGSGELFIHWPCELNSEEAELLGKLISSLGYLGRSESWVEAQLTDEAVAEWNAVPCVENEHRGPGWEQVSLMATISPTDYEQWRVAQVQEALRPFQDQKQSAPVKKKQAQAIEPYPDDLLSCLTKDTTWWKGHGWSQPPGSRRVLYWRLSDSLQGGTPVSPTTPHRKPVTTMLLSLTTPSGNRASLPPCTRTLPQAERFHKQVVGKAGNGVKIDCPEITGKDGCGRPLHSHHDHAHTIPVDLDGDGRLDHLIIFAKRGLGDMAQRAIHRVKRTWAKGVADDIQVAVVGYWRDDEETKRDLLRQLQDARLRTNLESILGPPGGARIWESVTPFVPPRFLKPRGKNSIEGQINAELVSRQFRPAEVIEVKADLTHALRHYIRRRSRGGTQLPMDAGFGLRLIFSEPITGPLLLGYASHYGLGLFRSVTG